MRWAGQIVKLPVYRKQNGAAASLETLGAEGQKVGRSPDPGRRSVGSGCPKARHGSDQCHQETHFHLSMLLLALVQTHSLACPRIQRFGRSVYSDPAITEHDKMHSHSTLKEIMSALSGKFFDLMKNTFHTDK